MTLVVRLVILGITITVTISSRKALIEPQDWSGGHRSNPLTIISPIPCPSNTPMPSQYYSRF